MGLHQTLSPSDPSLDACSFCGMGNSYCKCSKFDAEARRSGHKMSDTPILNKLKAFATQSAPIITVALDDGRESNTGPKIPLFTLNNVAESASQNSGMASNGPSGPI